MDARLSLEEFHSCIIPLLITSLITDVPHLQEYWTGLMNRLGQLYGVYLTMSWQCRTAGLAYVRRDLELPHVG